MTKLERSKKEEGKEKNGAKIYEECNKSIRYGHMNIILALNLSNIMVHILGI